MKSSIAILFVCAALAPVSYQEDSGPGLDQNKICYLALDELNNTLGYNRKVLDLDRLYSSQPDLVDHLMKLKDDRFLSAGNEYRAMNTELFQKVNNKYYYVEDKFMVDWYMAKSLCSFLGGRLVSIRNDDQFIVLSNYLRDVVKETMQFSRFWLDSNDICQEGKFMSLTYAYWEANQPDNFGNNEDCVELRRKFERFVMNDMPCFYKNYFICEREMPPEDL